MHTLKNKVISTRRRAEPYCAPIAAAVLWLLVGLSGSAPASERIVSTMEMMPGVAAVDGIRVVPAPDVPGRIYTEDYAPSQVLEIIRPNNQAISVGRITTSCSCVQASMEKRTFQPGERAFVEIRNVKPSQPNGAEYAVFVQMNSPYSAVLQTEIFVKSNRQPGDPGGMQPGAVPLESILPANVSSGTIVVAPVSPGTASSSPRINYEQIAPYAPKASAPAVDASGSE